MWSDSEEEEHDRDVESKRPRVVFQETDAATGPGPKRRGSLVEAIATNIRDIQGASVQRRQSRRQSKYFGFEDSDDAERQARRDGDSVRQNMLRRQTRRQEHLQMLADRAKERHEIAQSRRQLLESKRDAQTAALWFSILSAVAFSYRLDNKREIHHAITLFALKLGPVARLKQHRMRKHAFLKEALERSHGPTVADLEKDDMLRSFGRRALERAVEHARPKVFLAGTTLAYQGEEGRECFFVAYGTVDIVAAANGAEELLGSPGPGNTLGVPGMVSGSKRIARIVAQTDVLAYVIWRSDVFEGGIDPTLAKRAIQAAEQLHLNNMSKLYADSISGAGLAKYPMFHGVADSVLALFTARNILKPRVYHVGEVLVSAGAPSSKLIFILNGTVHAVKQSSVPSNVAPIEALAHMSDMVLRVSNDQRASPDDNRDLMRRRVDAFASIASDSTRGSRDLVGTLGKKSMIGGPAFFLLEPFPLTIVAAKTVDAVVLESRDFIHLMLAEPTPYKRMRANSCAALAAWLKQPTRYKLLQAVFPDVAQNAVKWLSGHTKHHWFDLVPEVVLRGENLEFDADHRSGYIVCSGNVEGQNSSRTVAMWPPVHILFFGNISLSTVVTAKVECWRLSRREFIKGLKSMLTDDQLQQLYVDLFRFYEQRQGKVPPFEELPGISVMNPMLGFSAPAPLPNERQALPARSKGRNPRGSTASADSATYEIQESEQQQPMVTTEDKPQRRRSSVMIVEDGEVSVLGAHDELQHSQAHSRTRVPLLPANFGSGHARPPMRAAIAEAIRSSVRQRKAWTARKAPENGPAEVKPPSKPVSARNEFALTDPYSRIFHDEEIADIHRQMEPGGRSRPHLPHGKDRATRMIPAHQLLRTTPSSRHMHHA